MANQFFCLSIAFLAALLMAGCDERKLESLVSTFTKKSFQSDKACVDQFNDKFSEYLQLIKGPEKANTSLIHRIGKEAEEIISKKINDMIWYCNGTTIEVSPYIITHLHKNGRNFYVEQLAIQRIVVKPILKLDQPNMKEMDVIRARINETTREKLKMEIANKQQIEPLNLLELRIIQLKKELRNVTVERDIHKNIGLELLKVCNETTQKLRDENKKYDQIKVNFDYIITSGCGCQSCKPNQPPNWNSFLATRDP